jgi:hypothetical protein
MSLSSNFILREAGSSFLTLSIFQSYDYPQLTMYDLCSELRHASQKKTFNKSSKIILKISVSINN